jgi:hypothetical protein
VGRVIKLPGGRRINYDELTVEQQQQVDAWLNDVWLPLLKANPLEGFEPHGPAQAEFLAACTPVVAAFAGNRFGKSTSLIVKTLIECLSEAWVPEHLRPFKRFLGPTKVWLLCPTEDKIFDTFRGAIEKWCPPSALVGGSWGKAFNGQRMELRFANGSFIGFKTYKQDPSTLGGADLHVVGYDEPPPLLHREECMTRLADHGGYEMFAMTPLKTNTGWIRRDIFKKRESPDITVVRGSMHDNPNLDKVTVARLLSTYSSDLWRQAREFGDFVDIGGLIYREFGRQVVKAPWPPEVVRAWMEHLVIIDPGVRNAGFVWVGFDHHNVAYVFDDGLIQDGTVEDYVALIQATNGKWGLKDPGYVIDPAARQRDKTNAVTVQTALASLGIFTENGQNDVEAGIQQVRGRLQHQRLWISPECRGLQDEADDYAFEEREDGKAVPIKGNDHRLDALRYGCMARPFWPEVEASAPDRNLGWTPGEALKAAQLQPAVSTPPMGSMS